MTNRTIKIMIVSITLALFMFLAPWCFGAWDNDLPADNSVWNNAAGEIRNNNDALEDALGVDLVNASKRYDVTSYGAAAGDSTDDTSFFALAITAAAGNTVYVPTGTFDVTGITLNQQVRLFMEPGAKLFLIASSNTPVVTISTEDCEVEGGQIDGNRSNQSANTGHGIFIEADNTYVKNVTITSIEGSGIEAQYAGGADNIKIEDCTITDTSRRGIFITNTPASAPSANIEIVNNHVDRTGDSAVSVGIYVDGNASGTMFSGVRVIGNYVKDTVAASPGARQCINGSFVKNSVFSDNTTSGGYAGLSIEDSNNVTVTGNAVFGAFKNGIEFAGTNRSTISSNTINGNGVTSRGILVSTSGADNTHNTLSDNTIWGIIGNCIEITHEPDYISITGNNIEFSPTDAGNRSAIFTTGADYFTISNNTIKGSGTAKSLTGIQLLNPGPGTCNGIIITNMVTAGINFN
ncbi:hypothetical protein LCGC14_1798790, partial [marine sediment metagenome]